MGARRGLLRIIGGSLRGRRLRAPSGSRIRPTSDRVREALFDILGSRVTGSAFLDAYSGTGAVGIEALSRGAASVTFIEEDPEAFDLLQKNLLTVGDLRAKARVMPRDLAVAIGQLERDGARFDLVYLDPPYEGGELDRALRLIGASELLLPGATVVAEHDARREATGTSVLSPRRTVPYGRAALTFFRRAVEEAVSPAESR